MGVEEPARAVGLWFDFWVPSLAILGRGGGVDRVVLDTGRIVRRRLTAFKSSCMVRRYSFVVRTPIKAM